MLIQTGIPKVAPQLKQARGNHVGICPENKEALQQALTIIMVMSPALSCRKMMSPYRSPVYF